MIFVTFVIFVTQPWAVAAEGAASGSDITPQIDSPASQHGAA